MWSLLWIRLGRRKSFWSKLLLFSSVLHVVLLFSIFFIFSWQKSILEVNINRSILKSGAPIVFASCSLQSKKLSTRSIIKSQSIAKPIKKQPVKKVVTQKSVQKKVVPKKIVAKKILVKKNTMIKKKPVPKKIMPKKIVSKKPVVKKLSVKKVLPKAKPVVKKSSVKKDRPQKVMKKNPVAKKIVKPVVKHVVPKQEVKLDTRAMQDCPIPVYIGKKEIESLSVEYEIEREVKKHWRPPAGLSKGLSCTMHILVDWSGRAKQSRVSKASGVLAFDISVRNAVPKMCLPKSVRGKELNITFNP